MASVYVTVTVPDDSDDRYRAQIDGMVDKAFDDAVGSIRPPKQLAQTRQTPNGTVHAWVVER